MPEEPGDAKAVEVPKSRHDVSPGPEVDTILAIVRELMQDIGVPEPSTALLLYSILQVPGTTGHRLLGSLPGELRAQLTLESLEQASIMRNGISLEHIEYAARRIAFEISGDRIIDSRHLLMTCLVGAGYLASLPELKVLDTDSKSILGRSNLAVRAMRYAGVDAEKFLDKIRGNATSVAQDHLQLGFPGFILLWRQQNRIRAFRIEEIGEFTHQPLSKVSSFPAILGLPDYSLTKTIDSILELEDLLNHPKAPELAYQKFFEAHPEFLMTDEHIAVRAGVSLTSGEEYGLRPDFFLQRRDVPYWDIAELKLPTATLVRGIQSRRGWAATVHSAVDQLRQYRRFFENSELARQVREVYGLDVYYPRLTLVIGRDAAFGSYRERQALVPPEARVLTYDDLLRIAKHRSLVLPFLRRGG